MRSTFARQPPRVWVLALGALGACAAVRDDGPDARYAIVGRVADGAGRPVAGALVAAAAAGSPLRHATVSDERGRFRIEPGGVALEVPYAVALADPRFTSPSASARPGGAPVEVRASAVPEADRLASSAEWLALLPEGEWKRWFQLDCTGCHQLNETRAQREGAPRSAAQWNADAARMHLRFGPESGFPIVSGHLAATDLGAWLAPALARPRVPLARRGLDAGFTLTEYDLPGPDLPHDLALDAAGRVLVTGMFTNRILVLDPATGDTEPVEIPVEQANPRAIEVDSDGNWWVLLGAAQRIARYEPRAQRWTSAEVGFYGHSIALDREGAAWTNDHFAREAPRLARVRPRAALAAELHALPSSRTAARGPSPIPYELRVAGDGRIWLSLLHGNEVVSFDPETGASDSFPLPDPDAGPRRFDLDARGDLWIPGYTSSALYRLDPERRRFDRHPLPIPDALPYVVRVDPGSGDLWIGTGAADALLRFDPERGVFSTYPVPTRGATMRHLAIDAATGDVWIAYGASPAIHPTRIARLTLRRR